MDREKIIKEYEDYVNSYISLTTSHDYEFEMHKAVLSLLKEQDAVVRCKDCVYAESFMESYKCYFDDENESGCKKSHDADFFCADGERQKGR